MDIKYKRILIINDDDKEDIFFEKYKILREYRNIIYYCNNPQEAFEIITEDNFSGFDKIILDIKIDWKIPNKYKDNLNKYVEVEELSKVNMGFMFFMYLISRGYPIGRIAFLSAYIKEQDTELKKKQELLNKVNGFKIRNQEQDELIIKYLDDVPSIKNRVRQCLENKEQKGVKAYKVIKKILKDDIGAESARILPENNKDIENNEQFFSLLEKTGLKVGCRINKKDSIVLKKWIISEPDELKKFYEFRNEMLNICEVLKKEEELNIYKLYNDGNFKKNYPKEYFDNLILKVQYEIFELAEERKIESIIRNVVNSFIAFWESLDKKYIEINADVTGLNNHAITMVLKNTRNWYAHGRVKKVDLDFCKFIFYLSIRVIYGDKKDIEKYIYDVEKVDEFNVLNDEELYREVWFKINNKIIDVKNLKTNTYTLNVVDLYYKYSLDKARKHIFLDLVDLYEMFILSLHYPYINKTSDCKYEVLFNCINYKEQEKYMKFLEKMALDCQAKLNKNNE